MISYINICNLLKIYIISIFIIIIVKKLNLNLFNLNNLIKKFDGN